jgi:hypothetical protein
MRWDDQLNLNEPFDGNILPRNWGIHAVGLDSSTTRTLRQLAITFDFAFPARITGLV